MPPKKQSKTKPPSSPNLKSLSREALEDLISDLYGKFDQVRSFIDLRITGNSEPLVKKFKKLIKNRLIEDIEEGTNGLDEAVKAVRHFPDYCPAPYDQADIMLFFVETVVDYINQYGDLYEDFYDETDDIYQEALDFMKKHKLLDDFKTRCKKIVDESADTGYGFHDSLGDTYYTYFPDGKVRQKKIHVVKPVLLKPTKISRHGRE